MTQDAPDADQAASDVPAKPERSAMSDAALRAYIDDRFADVADQFTAGEKRMQTIEDKVSENTVITADIHDFLVAARTGFKVLGWLGEGGKWLVKFATPFVALWGIWNSWHNGAPPHSK